MYIGVYLPCQTKRSVPYHGPEQSDQKLFMGGNASPLFLSNYIQKYEENNDIENMRAGPGMLEIRGGNRLHSQLPSECNYLQSTQVNGDYE